MQSAAVVWRRLRDSTPCDRNRFRVATLRRGSGALGHGGQRPGRRASIMPLPCRWPLVSRLRTGGWRGLLCNAQRASPWLVGGCRWHGGWRHRRRGSHRARGARRPRGRGPSTALPHGGLRLQLRPRLNLRLLRVLRRNHLLYSKRRLRWRPARRRPSGWQTGGHAAETLWHRPELGRIRLMLTDVAVPLGARGSLGHRPLRRFAGWRGLANCA
mmetsp:Transcript_34582/g.95244  ORF Transcript_34582/g.95244 Transcript_34582/m.95244 type:complete len:214 (-) Transcript_34582:854-1495(-)